MVGIHLVQHKDECRNFVNTVMDSPYCCEIVGTLSDW
jgi:hypothetical protein